MGHHGGELEAAVNLEQLAPVLERVAAAQPEPLHVEAADAGRPLIGVESGGNDEAHEALLAKQARAPFQKQLGQVGVAAGLLARHIDNLVLVERLVGALLPVDGFLVLAVQCRNVRVLLQALFDGRSLALGGGGEDLEVEAGEKLLRLRAHRIPRRVAEDGVEAAAAVGDAGGIEDLGESEVVGQRGRAA